MSFKINDMKLIILDAGDSFELDGFNKLLIKHPLYKKTIIELYKDIFNVEYIEIVVGYKAIQILNEYPNFNYIYNKKWQTTASGYSLSLALDEIPAYIVPSDYILDKETINLMDKHQNCALIKYNENRRLSSLNAHINKNGFIESIYRGKSTKNDPELLGIFKITNKTILKQWKKNSIINSNNYAGETLPLVNETPIKGIISNENTFEINTPDDYINFLNKIKQ
jgi:choline kinase